MSTAKVATKRAVSAGGVVYRRAHDTTEVILCGRKEPPLWGLPKGTPNAGETLEKAAAREVREETGVEVEIEARIGSIDYWFVRAVEGTRYHKTVHYFLMVPVGGDVSLHDHEFDEVKWFPAEEAQKVLSYKNEADMVVKALALVRGKSAAHEEGELW